MLYPLHKDSAPLTSTSIMLKSGRYLDLFNPRPEDIELDDVAAGLEQPRFKNQTTQPITIADHLLRCGRFAIALGMPLDVVIACLLHDVGEFALGDPPGPIKRCMAFIVDGSILPFKSIEDRHMAAVVMALISHEGLAARVINICTGVDEGGHLALKAVDEAALHVEALTWMPGAENWVPSHAVDDVLLPALFASPAAGSWADCAALIRAVSPELPFVLGQEFEGPGSEFVMRKLRHELTGRHEAKYPRATI